MDVCYHWFGKQSACIATYFHCCATVHGHILGIWLHSCASWCTWTFAAFYCGLMHCGTTTGTNTLVETVSYCNSLVSLCVTCELWILKLHVVIAGINGGGEGEWDPPPKKKTNIEVLNNVVCHELSCNFNKFLLVYIMVPEAIFLEEACPQTPLLRTFYDILWFPTSSVEKKNCVLIPV